MIQVVSCGEEQNGEEKEEAFGDDALSVQRFQSGKTQKIRSAGSVAVCLSSVAAKLRQPFAACYT